MPGHANSPYWTAVDFDSEGDEEPSPNSSHRVYLDPWDSEQYSFGRVDTGESSQGENFNSMAGEPVSASFYYVPTKNYESDEEEGDGESPRAAVAPPPPPTVEELSAFRQQRRSRQHHHHVDHHPEMFNYGYDVMPMPERRRSIYNGEDPYYALQPMVYEPVYLPLPPPMLPPHGMHVPPPPSSATRKRVSLPAAAAPHHEYAMSIARNGKHRRPSRYTEACDRYAYETHMYEYGAVGPAQEDWTRRALPKSAPDNFHLSRYGHLKIDYSCSWSSLDRLIRNQ